MTDLERSVSAALQLSPGPDWRVVDRMPPLLASEAAVPVVLPDGSRGVVVIADPIPAHPRDIRAATIATAVPLTTHPPELAGLLVASRRELGFFPDHLPRLIEYPWVLSAIRARGPRPLRLADIGAGINVLPIVLHDEGHEVTTVDRHEVDRTGVDRAAWNEWGFLDYASLRAGLRSVRASFEQWVTDAPFDVLYSVSVVEHLPAAARRVWIERMAGLVTPEGCLLLTIDLVPGSRRLWTFAESVEVEPAAIHGTIDDLAIELAANGFQVTELIVHDRLPNSRVGVALVRATREPAAQRLLSRARAVR